jgi:hypothetical protein
MRKKGMLGRKVLLLVKYAVREGVLNEYRFGLAF